MVEQARVLVGTLVVVILEILTESPSLADIIVFAVTFAITGGLTYFIVSVGITVITKRMKKSK